MEEGAHEGERACTAQESHNVILVMVEPPSKFHYLNKAEGYFQDSRALPSPTHGFQGVPGCQHSGNV